MHYPRTVAAIAAASLLAAFAAQANKGASYQAPKAEPDFPRYTLTGGVTYLQPSMNGLPYATIDVQTNPAGPPLAQNSTEYNLQPGYSAGYYLAAGYMINKHYDIQGSWALYNSEDDESLSATGKAGSTTLFGTSNFLALPLPPDATGTAYSEDTLNTQVADITVGQYHEIIPDLTTRIFAGVRYAQISSEVNNTYTLPYKEETTTDQKQNNTLSPINNFESSYFGIGPELGLDVTYEIVKNFDLVGSFAGAFLIGKLESESRLPVPLATASVPPGGGPGLLANKDPFIYNTIESDHDAYMVPTLDAKLGVNWVLPFKKNEALFMIEGGYQVAYYFNAVDQVQFQAGAGGGSRSGIILSHDNYASVGIMGPYLNLSASF